MIEYLDMILDGFTLAKGSKSRGSGRGPVTVLDLVDWIRLKWPACF
jgi:hypothetical protein